MATTIRKYDYNYFVVVVSQYQWEQQFSKELGEALMHCGALNAMEMTNHFSPRFGNMTTFLNIYDKQQVRQPRTNLYHPYAFVGIPGLSAGMGFERLRANQGFYLNAAIYPYADLTVRLRYNSLTSMYAFDQDQFHKQFHFDDTYEDVFYNYDMSLRKNIGQILSADFPAYNNFRQNIYYEAIDEIIYSNTPAGQSSEAERVFLLPGEKLIRKDKKGGQTDTEGMNDIYVQLSYKTQYYRYVMNHIYQFIKHECLPPYTDTRADFNDASLGAYVCFDYAKLLQIELGYDASLTPEIFKCYSGIVPYKCP